MAYKALYRTYRPTTFEEVAGQQHIVKTLKNALITGKIAHAYLFAGPRGTGKTTMAKLFAKALNCENGIGHQCNECKNCKSINDGSHPDVMELDAASNNGVDEIRALIDRVKYGTILGKYKVYIIDEVHMLSVGAFNALLKTLEEPPEHVIFILATTEPHKILPTILSRCQRYDFTKVSDNDIKERIRTILEHENIEFNEEAINLIISLCDGGMRDALSILDQVLAYSGNTLNVDDILDVFSLESTDEKINLIKSIAKNDTNDVLTRVNNYFDKGSDIKRLTEDLLTILKDALVYKTSHRSQYLNVLNEQQASLLANLIDEENILKMIEILLNASKDIKAVSAINPLFEVSILKMSTLNNTKKLEDKIDGEEEKIISQNTPEMKTQNIPQNQTIIVENTAKTQDLIQNEEKDEIPVSSVSSLFEIKKIDQILCLKNTLQDDKFVIDEDTMIKIMVTSKKDLKNTLLDHWADIKKCTLNPALSKAAGLLVDCHPLVVNGKILVVETQMPKIAEKINSEINQADLQTLVNTVFDKKLFVYAVDRNGSINFQTKYLNLLQINKLPKQENVLLEYEGE